MQSKGEDEGREERATKEPEETEASKSFEEARQRLACRALAEQAEEREAAGQLADAERLLGDAVACCARSFGHEDSWTLEAAQALADCYSRQSRYGPAAGLYEEILRVLKKQTGENNSRYAALSGRLAQAYDQLGSYAEAEMRYREALRISSYLFGATDERTVVAMFNIAELARVRGESAAAEAGIRRALEIEQRARGQGTANGALFRNNLGELYLKMGRYDEATELLQGAAELRAALFGVDSSQHARSLVALFGLEAARGRLAEARGLGEQARAIYRRLEDHGGELSCDSLLAQLQMAEGDSAGAVTALESALAGLANLLGEMHPTLIPALAQLARMHCLRQEWKEARQVLSRALGAADLALIETLRSGSRALTAADARRYTELQDLLLGSVLDDPERGRTDLQQAYDCVLRRKGIETRSLRLQKPGPESHLWLSPAPPPPLPDPAVGAE
ncbi:MAG: tetratricopeptide repeat protein, partial [Acidobacteriota bacterium]|nr:tetratricopeptide repeat protein [Acidobacteriota bacterium]